MFEKKTRIVFAGHDLKFAKGLIEYYQNKDSYEVKIDLWEGHNTHNEEHSLKCVSWADVVFCEWGLGNAVWYSLNKKRNQKLYIRMHRQELETEYPKHINIDNVEQIIAISPYIYEEFYRVFKFPRNKMVLIYNYVNTDKFDFIKNESTRYHLGIIGICPSMKRLDLAIDVFESLWKEDKRFKLFIKGKKPEEYAWIWNNEKQREYYEKLFNRIESSDWKENVIFDGFGDDVAEWLGKIGYVLSTSDFESFHLAVAEGMASRSIPIIRNWAGAHVIYGSDFLFREVGEAVSKIKYYNGLETESYEELRTQVKQYCAKHFSFKEIIKEYNELF